MSIKIGILEIQRGIILLSLIEVNLLVIMVFTRGPGRHTMIAHGFGTSSESVTEVIRLKNDTSAFSVFDFKNNII